MCSGLFHPDLGRHCDTCPYTPDTVSSCDYYFTEQMAQGVRSSAASVCCEVLSTSLLLFILRDTLVLFVFLLLLVSCFPLAASF